LALAAAAVLSGGPFACSSSNQLSGAGGACTVVTDCQDGLVCCNAGKNAPTCASAVTCLLPPGTMLVDGATPPVGDDQSDASAAGEPDAPMSSPDAAREDSGVPNKPDAGTPPDAGPPPVVDSGTPQDAGMPLEAAPPPPDDSGSGSD
jgi:hypothetical protein